MSVPAVPKTGVMFPCSLRYFPFVPLFPKTPGRPSILVQFLIFVHGLNVTTQDCKSVCKQTRDYKKKKQKNWRPHKGS